MTDQIIDPDALASMLRGVNKLADVARITLGPGRRNVIVAKKLGAMTLEGVTVAKEIELSDPIENMGEQMVREIASKTSDVVGDGTTTATVLAQAIYRECARRVLAGADPIEVRRGIELGVDAAVTAIDQLAQPVKGEDIARVGTISADNDQEIGRIVFEALEKAGKDGVFLVEETPGPEMKVELAQGMQLDCGYLSPYFVTDAERMEAVLEDCKILLFTRKISSMEGLLPILEQVARHGRSLLILAEGIEKQALATLIVNRLRGTLRVAAAKVPGSGTSHRPLLDDIAALAGGKVFTGELDGRLENVRWEDLGDAKKVVLTRSTTTIVSHLPESGRHTETASRVKQIRQQIEDATSEHHREKLKERLARLTRGLAIIKVSAGAAGLAERRTRTEHALSATRAAAEEGVVPGGGVALLRAIKAVKDIRAQGDVRVGLQVVRHALQEPARQIAINAGEEGSAVVRQVLATSGGMGYNAAAGRYENLLTAGIIDPAKVTKTALLNAATVSGLMLSTEGMVSRLRGLPENSARVRGEISLPPEVMYEKYSVDPIAIAGGAGAGFLNDEILLDDVGSLSVSGLTNRRSEEPKKGGRDDPEPPEKRINIWITGLNAEQEPPLPPGTMVTLNFQVGRLVAASLVDGPATRVSLADIPEEGLPTDWVISSRTVALAPGTIEPIGDSFVYQAIFSLLIPREGDSEVVQLNAIPHAASGARLDVLIYARGTLYRQLEVELLLKADTLREATPGGVDVCSQMTYRLPGEIGRQPAQAWARPPGSVEITVGSSSTQLKGKAPTRTGLWEPNMNINWPPRAAVAPGIEQVRAAAETFRETWQDYLNNLPAEDFESRIQNLGLADLPSDWEHLPDAADEAQRQAWDKVAVAPTLFELAYWGHELYQTFFPRGTEMRDRIDELIPGVSFHINWLDNFSGAWSSHVPWGLMYREEPAPGQPVDPMNFFGLRFRIGYVPYEVATAKGALGRPDTVWAAHGLYWGTDGSTWIESQWQRARWSRWPNQVIIPVDPAEPEAKAGLVRLFKAPEKRPMAVLYFFCRSAEGNGSNDLVLRFGSSSSTANDLRQPDMGSSPFADRPFVFANACSTAAADPYIANLLEMSFIKSRGCRAFLGTEAKVPIVLASRFAATFFHFFFRQVGHEPVSAGEAVAQARLFLWTRYRNLGGLFYCLVNKYDLYMADEQEILSLPA